MYYIPLHYANTIQHAIFCKPLTYNLKEIRNFEAIGLKSNVIKLFLLCKHETWNMCAFHYKCIKKVTFLDTNVQKYTKKYLFLLI